MKCVSSLGHGILWPLFEENPRYNFLFTREVVTLEQWPEWAKQRVVHRTRSLGEKHEPVTGDEMTPREKIMAALKIINQ